MIFVISVLFFVFKLVSSYTYTTAIPTQGQNCLNDLGFNTMSTDSGSNLMCYSVGSGPTLETGIITCYDSSLPYVPNQYLVTIVDDCSQYDEGEVKKYCYDTRCPQGDQACCLSEQQWTNNALDFWGVVGTIFFVLLIIAAVILLIGAGILIFVLCIFCGIQFSKLKKTPIYYDPDEDFGDIKISPLYGNTLPEQDDPESSDSEDEKPEEKQSQNTENVVKPSQAKKTDLKEVMPKVVKQQDKAQVEIVKSNVNVRPQSVGKFYNFGNAKAVFEKK